MMIQMLMGGGRGAIVSPFPLTDLGDEEITPSNAYCELRLDSDGTITLAGGDSTGGPNWFAPTIAGVGTLYWVRVTKTAGTNNTAGDALSSWLSLSGVRFWGWLKSGLGSISATITVEIALDAAGVTVVSTVTGVPVLSNVTP